MMGARASLYLSFVKCRRCRRSDSGCMSFPGTAKNAFGLRLP